MIKLASQLVALKLDAEKEGKTQAKKYGVTGFPTILFLDPMGEVVGRIGGYMPPEPFFKEVTRINASFQEFPKIQAALKAKPDDGEANAKMAAALVGRGKLKEGQEHLRKAEKANFQGEALFRAYNAVGDLHQNEERLDEAIDFFRKADAPSAPAEVQSYARISLAQCYSMKRDLRGARREAKRVLEVKGAPEEHQKMARDFLERSKGEEE